MNSNIVNSNKSSTNGAYNGVKAQDLQTLLSEVQNLKTVVQNREMTYRLPEKFGQQVGATIHKYLKENVQDIVKDEVSKIKKDMNKIQDTVKHNYTMINNTVANTSHTIEVVNEKKVEKLKRMEFANYLLGGISSIVFIGVNVFVLVLAIATSIAILPDYQEWGVFKTTVMSIGGLAGLIIVITVFKKFMEWWEYKYNG